MPGAQRSNQKVRYIDAIPPPRIVEIRLLPTAGPYIPVIDVIPDIPAFPVKSRYSADGAARA